MHSFYFKVQRNIFNIVEDLIASAKLWRYWLFRSFVIYRLRFQGSRLALLWPVISLLFVVAVLGTVWGIILGKGNEYDYYLYLVVGFPVWQFISGAVKEGNKGLIDTFRNDGLPFTVFLYERWSLNSLALVNVIPLMLMGAFFFGYNGYEHFLYLPLAIVCLALWAFGTIALLALIVSLKPDLKHLVNSLMRLSFLATPIIWEPTRLGDYQQYLWLNPFFAPLEMARYAISGVLYMPDVLWFAPVYSVLVFLVGLTLFARYLNALKFRIAA